jgi:glycerate kinase
MRILIAPDTLKGSLNATEAANAIEAGLHLGLPNAECIKIPISDGGEGFLSTLASIFPNMQKESANVTGPQGLPLLAHYGFIPAQKTAFIEWAEAAGLHAVPTNKQHALSAQSTGIGQLIKKAGQQGAKRLIIGLGGSATCDGAVGALAVMGFRFLDKAGKPISPDAAGLLKLEQIETDAAGDFKHHQEIIVLHDVNNPLTGKAGAVVYAKQKGATPKERQLIQQAFTQYARVLEAYTQKSIQSISGTGAAGGAGAGLYALLNAQLMPGADWILKHLNMAEKIQATDCVIVAEGSLDAQSLQGKAPLKIAALAKKYNKPVIALVGKNSLNTDQLDTAGITAVFSLANGPMSKKTAFSQAKIQLQNLSQQLGRCLHAFIKK